MPSASYDGPALDATGQHISDAPYWQGDGETVDVVDDRIDAAGEIRVEVFPVPPRTRTRRATRQRRGNHRTA